MTKMIGRTRKKNKYQRPNHMPKLSNSEMCKRYREKEKIKKDDITNYCFIRYQEVLTQNQSLEKKNELLVNQLEILKSNNKQNEVLNTKLINKLGSLESNNIQKSVELESSKRQIRRLRFSLDNVKQSALIAEVKRGRKRKRFSQLSQRSYDRRVCSATKRFDNKIVTAVEDLLNTNITYDRLEKVISRVINLEGLSLSYVNLVNDSPDDNINLSTSNVIARTKLLELSEMQKQEIEHRRLILLQIMDQHNISMATMHTLHVNLADVIPSKHYLQKERGKLNLEITESLGLVSTDQGAYIDPTKLILYLFDNKLLSIGDESTLMVLVQGDGRRACSKYSSVAFTARFLNNTAQLPPEHHLYDKHLIVKLSTMHIEEKYDQIASCFKPMFDLLAALQQSGITLSNNRHIKISLYLSSDWKMLKILRGLKSPNSSSQFCCWCYCNREDRMKVPTTRMKLNPIESDRYNHSVGTFGLKFSDMVPFIPVKNMVVDILHMLLRVSDVLLKIMVTECQRTYKKDEQALDAISEEFKRIQIHHFKFFTPASSIAATHIAFTTLQGPDKLKYLHNFDCNNIFAKKYKQNATYINSTIREFASIYDTLRKSESELKEAEGINHLAIQQQINSFMSRFNQTDLNKDKAVPGKAGHKNLGFHSSLISPYMHTLHHHTAEFIKIHGSVSIFTCQHLELVNQLDNRAYFSCNSKRDVEKELFLKSYRIIFNPSNIGSAANFKCGCGKPYKSEGPYLKHIEQCGRGMESITCI
jgi:hypothetical protein